MQNMRIPGLQFILSHFLSDDDIYLYKLPDGLYVYFVTAATSHIYLTFAVKQENV
jgi:hypothetical protein